MAINTVKQISAVEVDGTSIPLVQPKLASKEIIENGTYLASNDNVDGYSEVVINVPSLEEVPTETIDITENGTYSVLYYANANVNVPPVSNEYTLDKHYKTKVIDYDGTILYSDTQDVGDAAKDIVLNIKHDGLTLEGFSSNQQTTLLSSLENVKKIYNYDEIIGPIYTTTSGMCEFDIVVTKKTGLTVQLNMAGTKSWGDGASDSTTSHTYAKYGNYTVTCSATSWSITSSNGIVGQLSDSNLRGLLQRARLKNVNNSIPAYCFQYCEALETVSIPNGITSLGSYSFSYCKSLKALILPPTLTTINTYSFNYCLALKALLWPRKTTTIRSQTLNQNKSLTHFTINSNLTRYYSSDHSLVSNCSGIEELEIPSSQTNIRYQDYYDCRCLSKIRFWGNITEVASSAFYSPNGTTALNMVYFNNNTVVPTLADTNAFGMLNTNGRIVVPDSLYDEWITATNWATYADYIYKKSEVDYYD